MKIHTVILILLLITAVGVVGAFQFTKSEPVHIHAGFLVYTNDQLQDFTDFRYQKIVPCTESHDNSKLSPAEEQLEKAHLHDGVGDVVHVHRPNALWSDLFTNINYLFQDELQGYIDGQLVDDILSTPIDDRDSVIFIVGNSTMSAQLLANPVSADRILQIEATSENCAG